MIALALALAAVAVTPQQPRQGDTVRVLAQAPAASARLNGRTVRLFPQAGSEQRLGLMPVAVLDRAGTFPLTILDDAGRVIETVRLQIRDGKFRKQNVVLGRATQELKPAPGEMETMRAFRETLTENRTWEEPLAAPVPGCMTSPFGVLRLHNGVPTGNYHGGVDQRGATGTPIRAVADGTVKVARMWNIHGGTVGIDHGQGLVSMYLHMSKIGAAEGAAVKEGDVIGYVGTTGRSTAPHLHWALFVNGVAVNPTQWVKMSPCGTPNQRTAPKRK